MSESEDEHTISENEFDVNQELRELYYSPAKGYRGVNDLYRTARERGIPVSQKQVSAFLKNQDIYTQHFPKGGPFVKKKFRPTIVGKLGQQLQMDLVIMPPKFINENDGNGYILTAIEILSRYAFTTYQKGKSSKETSISVEKILTEFKEHFGKYPDVAQFDQGGEFTGKETKKVFADKGIDTFSTLIRAFGWHLTVAPTKTGKREWRYTEYDPSKTDEENENKKYTLFQRKASIVERLNRTLKNMMWKYFDKHNTHQWIHILDDITHNYNNSYHRSIKMKPNEVNEDNAHQVWLTLYAENTTTVPPKPKFKIGDIVRVEKYDPGTRHGKGYTINFSDEKFKIIGIYRGVPTMYNIQEIDKKTDKKDDDGNYVRKEIGDEIVGRFYERELSKIN